MMELKLENEKEIFSQERVAGLVFQMLNGVYRCHYGQLIM